MCRGGDDLPRPGTWSATWAADGRQDQTYVRLWHPVNVPV